MGFDRTMAMSLVAVFRLAHPVRSEPVADWAGRGAGSRLHSAVVSVRLRHVSEQQRRLEYSSVASGSPAANPQPLLVHRESRDHAPAHSLHLFPCDVSCFTYCCSETVKPLYLKHRLYRVHHVDAAYCYRRFCWFFWFAVSDFYTLLKLFPWVCSVSLCFFCLQYFYTVWRQEDHLTCKNWVVRCWCGYLSGARCRLFACDPADATAIPKLHNFLPHLNPDWFYLSCTGLHKLSWKRGR